MDLLALEFNHDVAMQLASKRVFSEPRGTYESTQTRTFQHGRTEVTRSVSTESEAFCNAVCSGKGGVSKAQLNQLLVQACAQHSQYTKLASKGLRVIGISDESPGDVSAFLANHKVSYALALDPQNATNAAYLIQGLPTIFVIDKAGLVQFTAVGVPDFEQLDAVVSRLMK